jgi:hypothetical protein
MEANGPAGWWSSFLPEVHGQLAAPLARVALGGVDDALTELARSGLGLETPQSISGMPHFERSVATTKSDTKVSSRPPPQGLGQ